MDGIGAETPFIGAPSSSSRLKAARSTLVSVGICQRLGDNPPQCPCAPSAAIECPTATDQDVTISADSY